MGVILDTSVLIAAERGIFEVDAFVENREEEPFGLSVITVAELLHGVHRADSRANAIIASSEAPAIPAPPTSLTSKPLSRKNRVTPKGIFSSASNLIMGLPSRMAQIQRLG